MHVFDEGTTYIRRVRSSRRDADTLALQLRLRALLDTADLRPYGLSRHAIVLIRSLRAELPVYRDAPVSSWQPALSAAVATIVQNAARPGVGAIPADVAAIVFADRAELLACLARDWCAGAVATRWWWRSLLHGVDVEQFVAGAWLEQPRYVPAALEQLAIGHDLQRFVMALPPSVCAGLVDRLLHTYGLRDVAPALAPLLGTGVPLAAGGVGAALPGRISAAAPFVPEIGRRCLPELNSIELAPAQHALIVVGLLLARAPSLLRSPDFARALAEAAPNSPPAPVPAASSRLTAGVTAIENRRHSRRTDSAPGSRAGREMAARSHATAVRRGARRRQRAKDAPQASHDRREEGSVVRERRSPEAPATSAERVRLRRQGQLRARPPDVRIGDSIPQSETSVPIATAYGGLFYLVNLGLHLELYADFTRPHGPGLALPLWDWLALAGLELAGDPLRSDPVWPLLAQLARHAPGVKPGDGFDPPRDWRVPPAWLDAFPEPAVLRWWRTGDRLCVAHPAGFLLLDVPLRARAQIQLSEELNVYAPGLCAGLVCAAIRARHRTPQRRWLGWLVAYMRARLVRALGLPDAARLSDVLLRHPARIVASPGHLDVYLELADLPIVVRLAGLDRDPGWVPAAGCAFAFHFETSGSRP